MSKLGYKHSQKTKEKIGKKNTTHGETKTPFYRRWQCMKARCERTTDKEYKNYGARGITFCERWRKYENFRIDMHDTYLVHVEKHGLKNTTLNRIDNAKGYSKENCRWATQKEQQNNKRTNIIMTIGNETLNLMQWSKKLGISYKKLYYRFKNKKIVLC